MTFPVNFWLIVAFAWWASRACQLPVWQSLENALDPAAAQAFFPEALPGKMFMKVLNTQSS